MSSLQLDWKAWAEHIKDVFPYSDEIAKNDLHFSEEYGKPVLAIRNHRFFVKFVKHIKDTVHFIPPEDHYPLLYLTEQISAQKAERMRDSNTPFIDIKGNTFINLPGFYLFVMGRRVDMPSPLWPESRASGKLFKKSGVKLIHLLLTDPLLDQDLGSDLLSGNVRKLASKAGLSIGSVSELFSEMKERGFLLTDGKGRRLINRKILFDQWLHGYMDYRFKLQRLCFEASSIPWWRDRNPNEEGFLWGGEPAAALLTDDYLKPAVLTIYTNQPLYDLVVDANLHQVPSGGNVEFITPLTGGHQHHDSRCVHPLLVYADLICSSDDRNTETATRIYDQYLRDIIESA